MTDDDRLARFLRTKLQDVGRQYEEIRKEFATGHAETVADLPTDEEGQYRIVCRRYAEKRAVRLDAEKRPTCYEHGHTDCEGCVEDIDDGCIQTW
jgi:hypothetical protein